MAVVPQYFQAMYDRCASKPDAVEDHPWGETVFKVRGKVFAFLGRPESPSTGVTVKAPADELDVLLEADFIQRARYVGRYGWVSLRIADDNALQLALELIDDSYDLIRTRRRVTS
jgi:predicted DNA-binding protein (MmcQ/YjbR family)